MFYFEDIQNKERANPMQYIDIIFNNYYRNIYRYWPDKEMDDLLEKAADMKKQLDDMDAS